MVSLLKCVSILFPMYWFISWCVTYEPNIANGEDVNCNAGGTLGPDDICLIKCDIDTDIGDIDCKSAGICRLECTQNECFQTQELTATNAKNLEIYATGEQCLEESNFYLPVGGNASIIINTNGHNVADNAMFHSQSTDHIWITCIDTPGTDDNHECDDMIINAQDAQFLSLTAVGSELHRGEVNCPINSNYNGPYAAPCIVNVTYADASPTESFEINTKNGFPKDVLFYGNPDADVIISCTSPSPDTMTYDYNNPFDNSDPCFNTNAPTKSPTTNPSIPPTKNPSFSPTNPTQIPTQNPLISPTKFPTNNPSVNPTKYPSANPTKYPNANPTKYPSANPTEYPSANPTKYPSANPTEYPTKYPSDTVTSKPTYAVGRYIETSNTIQQTNDEYISNGTNKNGMDAIYILAIIIGVLILCVGVLIGIIISTKCGSKSKHTEQRQNQMVNSMEMTTIVNISPETHMHSTMEVGALRVNSASDISVPNLTTTTALPTPPANTNVVSVNADLGENDDSDEMLYENQNENGNMLPNTPKEIVEGNVYVKGNGVTNSGDNKETKREDLYMQNPVTQGI